MICRWDDFAADLEVIETTAPTPALPFITAHTDNHGAVRKALAAAIDALAEADRDTLGLDGIVDVPESAYLAVTTPTTAPIFRET
ncbi:MAG: hypothetical protein AAFX00_12955, partial [Pseudomonadota bacterium]